MMKLKINSYNKKFKARFQKEKNRISKIIKDCEVHHIGSTAVSGLGGKGIIDIMIGIKNWKESGKIIKKLEGLSFTHIHPKEKGRIFLSKDKTLLLSNNDSRTIKQLSFLITVFYFVEWIYRKRTRDH